MIFHVIHKYITNVLIILLIRVYFSYAVPESSISRYILWNNCNRWPAEFFTLY